MLNFTAGSYVITVSVGTLPSLYSRLLENASLREEIDISSSEGNVLFVGVTEVGSNWPCMIVSQRFEPGLDSGFYPGICLIPETHRLFIGAGTRLLAYDLRNQCRLWEDSAGYGFWGWKRHGDIILMSAELEMGAWDVDGKKLWSTFVEPPWTYTVEGEHVKLDVMGRKSEFPVKTGPNS